MVTYEYHYNPVGNLDTLEDEQDATRDRAFTYDDIGRLIDAISQDYPDTVVKYLYFANGNRKRVLSGYDTTINRWDYIYLNNAISPVF